MKAIIVCGAREALHRDWYDAVVGVIGSDDAITVLHGACGCDAAYFHAPSMKGIDRIAHDFARQFHQVVPMPAPWKTMGPAAGPFRNRQMLAALKALGECGYHIAVLGFHDDIEHASRGTKHMITTTRFARVPFGVYDRQGTLYMEGGTDAD